MGQLASGQAKYALGVGGALNYYPQTYNYSTQPGFGGVFQGEVKLNSAATLSLAPSLGLELPYIFYIGMSLRYYIKPRFYVQGGGYAHFDADILGPGGTAGLGYIIYTTKTQNLDLNFHVDELKFDNVVHTLFGIRVTYNFTLPPVGNSAERHRPPRLPWPFN